MKRSAWIATVAGALIVLAVVAVVRGTAPDQVTPSPSPSPLAVSPTPTSAPTTAAPTTSPTTTASPTPSPAPAGRHVNADMGYSLELGPPWRRSICGSSISGGPAVGTNGGDMFIPIPDADFKLGHIGPFSGNADTVHVFAAANPDDLSPRDWKRTRMGGSAGEQQADTTFAGRPALLVRVNDDETFVFAQAGYMWEVGHRLRTGSTALADRAAIVRSFRFVTADESRAARAAATPSPAPRTAEQVADVLADGFARRDVSVLARVIRPCFYEGVYQAGPDSMIAPSYVEKLRQRFAQGLTVEVRARPVSGDPSTTMKVRSTWSEPGQPVREADLTMTVHRGTTYWDGTITCVIGPCP